MKSLAEQLQDVCDANGVEIENVELTVKLRPKRLPLREPDVESFGEVIDDDDCELADVIVLAEVRGQT
jgi:hypothetical protein